MRSRYSPQLAGMICARIARGDPVRVICQSGGMPSPRTLFRWLAEHEDFLIQYERAQEAREAAGVGPLGKASTYSPEIATAICERIISGQTLRQIGRAEGMPGTPTLYRWLAQFPAFAKQFASAKAIQADVLAEEIIDIVDDPALEPFDKRVRMDGRKWLVARMKPRKYGDRTALAIEHPLKELSDEEIRQELMALVTKAKARMVSVAPAPTEAAPLLPDMKAGKERGGD